MSPASFLSCIRSSSISLTVEEEAALLDCLDLERLSDPDSHYHSHSHPDTSMNMNMDMDRRAERGLGLGLGLKRNTRSTAQYPVGDCKESRDESYGSPAIFSRIGSGRAVNVGTRERERDREREREREQWVAPP